MLPAHLPRASTEGSSSILNTITGSQRTKAQQDGSLRSLSPEILRMSLNPPDWVAHHSYSITTQKQAEEASLYLQHWHASPAHQRAQTAGGELPHLAWHLLLAEPHHEHTHPVLPSDGDEQLLAVVFERNAILRWGKRHLLVSVLLATPAHEILVPWLLVLSWSPDVSLALTRSRHGQTLWDSS